MGRKISLIKALLVTVGIPILLIMLFFQALSQGGMYILYFLAFLVIYLYWALDNVAYDSRTIHRINIPGASESVKEFLKATTTNGDLIYVILLQSFQNDEKLSQTDMTRYAQKRGVELTPQRIGEYVRYMETHRLITSPETRYEKEYRLTDKGKWCRNAVQQCFPSKTILFHIRNGLGLIHLDKFTNESDQSSRESGS